MPDQTPPLPGVRVDSTYAHCDGCVARDTHIRALRADLADARLTIRALALAAGIPVDEEHA
jgi:hypothetical protein